MPAIPTPRRSAASFARGAGDGRACDGVSSPLAPITRRLLSVLFVFAVLLAVLVTVSFADLVFLLLFLFLLFLLLVLAVLGLFLLLLLRLFLGLGGLHFLGGLALVELLLALGRRRTRPDVREVEFLFLVVGELAVDDGVLDEGPVVQEIAVRDDRVAVLPDLERSHAVAHAHDSSRNRRDRCQRGVLGQPA